MSRRMFWRLYLVAVLGVALFGASRCEAATPCRVKIFPGPAVEWRTAPARELGVMVSGKSPLAWGVTLRHSDVAQDGCSISIITSRTVIYTASEISDNACAVAFVQRHEIEHLAHLEATDAAILSRYFGRQTPHAMEVIEMRAGMNRVAAREIDARDAARVLTACDGIFLKLGNTL